MPLINFHILKSNIKKLFISTGLDKKSSEIVSDVLVEAELNGISTHGVSMVPAHIRKLRYSYNIEGKLEVVKQGICYSVFDANNMIGMVSAYQAMEYAIENAKKTGVYHVLCNHANTFSAASFYVEMAVDAGLIGIVFCNAPAQMAPLGGREKLIGTNPFAIGIPARNELPFIFDMATSVVAKSKINEAVNKGEKNIPDGWATDENGVPTNDPLKAIKGMILPMAGAKGYGLSVAIDIMAGLLSGASSLDEVGRFYPIENGCMNVGQFFTVIDPNALYGPSFCEEMDKYLNRIRHSKSTGNDPVIAPGDNMQQIKGKNVMHGIQLSEKCIEELNMLAFEMGVVLSW